MWLSPVAVLAVLAVAAVASVRAAVSLVETDVYVGAAEGAHAELVCESHGFAENCRFTR